MVCVHIYVYVCSHVYVCVFICICMCVCRYEYREYMRCGHCYPVYASTLHMTLYPYHLICHLSYHLSPFTYTCVLLLPSPAITSDFPPPRNDHISFTLSSEPLPCCHLSTLGAERSPPSLLPTSPSCQLSSQGSLTRSFMREQRRRSTACADCVCA